MQRDTQQRRAIRKVLAESGRPLAPDDVLQAGQVLVPSLGIATVYRSLKALVADGWLTEVELPGEVTRYELAPTITTSSAGNASRPSISTPARRRWRPWRRRASWWRPTRWSCTGAVPPAPEKTIERLR